MTISGNMKKTINELQNSNQPLVCLTAYTAPMAKIADSYCDIILVGDSVSMVLYGEDSTQKADMDMMIRHGQAVAKNAQNAFVIVDMPYGSYENDPIKALKNAQKIIDKTGCDGVKLEGGQSQAEIIAYLVQNDIPVMGHIGLLPQSVHSPEGYKVQGREEQAAQALMQDAMAVEKAGAFCVVIEAVTEPLAAAITASISIPTIGIGASNACDGQILVSEDMVGMSIGRLPKFVKQYANINASLEKAVKQYADDVQSRAFPTPENVYKPKNPDSMKDDLKKAS